MILTVGIEHPLRYSCVPIPRRLIGKAAILTPSPMQRNMAFGAHRNDVFMVAPPTLQRVPGKRVMHNFRSAAATAGAWIIVHQPYVERPLSRCRDCVVTGFDPPNFPQLRLHHTLSK